MYLTCNVWHDIYAMVHLQQITWNGEHVMGQINRNSNCTLISLRVTTFSKLDESYQRITSNIFSMLELLLQFFVINS